MCRLKCTSAGDQVISHVFEDRRSRLAVKRNQHGERGVEGVHHQPLLYFVYNKKYRKVPMRSMAIAIVQRS